MFKITKSTTTEVKDTNPKLYEERFNIAVKNGEYDKALEEIEEAIQYSQSNATRFECVQAKIDVLYTLKRECDIVECVKSQIPFFLNTVMEYKVIELINKNIYSNEIRESLYKECIIKTSDLRKILIELSKENKDFILSFLYSDFDMLIKKFGLLEVIKSLNDTDIDQSQKLYIVDHFYNLNKYELAILMGMSYIDVQKTKEYLDRDLTNIVNKIGINEFIEALRQGSLLTDIDKRHYLNEILVKNKSNLNILDEIIKYYGYDYDDAISYIDLLISVLYKNTTYLSLIVFRKGIVFFKKGDLKSAKEALLDSLKLSNEISNLQEGCICYNLSLIYLMMNEQKTSIICMIKAVYYSKKAKKLGYIVKENSNIETLKNSKPYKYKRNLMIALGVVFFLIIAFYMDNYNSSSYSYKYTSSNEDDLSTRDSYVYNPYDAESSSQNSNQADYLLPDSDSTYISEYKLSQYDKDTLALMRNEIYARHGYVFREEPYKSYFNSKSWYAPDSLFKGDDWELNKYEIENLKTIKSLENSKSDTYRPNSEDTYYDKDYPYDYVDLNDSQLYYAVYTEAYYNYNYATDYVKKLANKGVNSTIYTEDGIYKVRVGTASTYTDAQKIADKMSEKNINTYILAYDSEIEDEINNLKSMYNNSIINLSEFDYKYQDIKSKIQYKEGYGGHLKKLNDFYNKVHSNN